MRIELNSGDLTSGTAVLDFQSDFDYLIDRSRKMVSSFQTIKNFANNMNGGIGNLQNAVDQIGSRASTEESKINALRNIKGKANSFIEVARQIDLNVSGIVNSNKREFYKVNPWSKPPDPPEEKKWYQKAGDWLCEKGKAIKDGFNNLKDTVVDWGKSAADSISKAWDNAVDWCKAHKEQIAKIALAAVVVVSLVALTAVSGPVGVIATSALQGALVGGLVGAGIGGISSGYAYYNENGTLKGAGESIFAGAVDGMLDGVITGAASGAASGVGFVTKEGGIVRKLVTAGAVKSIGSVPTGAIDYYFDNDGSMEGAGGYLMKKAAIGFTEGVILEGVSMGTGKLGEVIKNKFGKNVKFDFKIFGDSTEVEPFFGSKYTDIMSKESMQIAMMFEKKALLSTGVMLKSFAQTALSQGINKTAIFFGNPNTEYVIPTGVKDLIKNGLKLFENKVGIA